MDRVRLPDAILVVAAACLAREVGVVAVVHLDEAARSRVDRRERVGVGRCEQPLADDVVRLVRRRGALLVGHAPHHVLEPLERLEAVRASDLLGVPGHRRASSPLSDAGIEMASSTPGVPLTASVSACANVN